MQQHQWEELERQARRELDEEHRRKLVDEIKEKLRNSVKPNPPWWAKVFPYRIKIEKVI